MPVPSVAMKESILIRVTSRPLMSPTTAPSSTTASAAAHHGRPCACRPMASTWLMPTLKPAERSNWFAAIGMKTDSATIACTDLLERIERMLK